MPVATTPRSRSAKDAKAASAVDAVGVEEARDVFALAAANRKVRAQRDALLGAFEKLRAASRGDGVSAFFDALDGLEVVAAQVREEVAR